VGDVTGSCVAVEVNKKAAATASDKAITQGLNCAMLNRDKI